MDDNCITHTVTLLKPDEIPPDNSLFWCHGCRVRHHIATRIDMQASSPSRTAKVLQHLLEVYPMYDSGGSMVERPRIPPCCDNPDEPYHEGVTCGCLCHYLTPEDLAEVSRLADRKEQHEQ